MDASALRSQRLGRLAQLRRDLSMVVRGLAGRGPSPVIAIDGDGRRRRPLARGARRLVVERIAWEGEGTRAITLADVGGELIAFLPGQFVTVRRRMGGRVVRRNYSIASSATEPRSIVLGVKRVQGGALSPWLTEQLAEGDELEVLGPHGQFAVATHAQHARTLLLVAGGIGITPLLSIAETVLEREPLARVVLVYGARSRAHLSFRRRLDALVEEHGARLSVRYVVEAGDDDNARTGRLDRRMLASVLSDLDSSELAAVDAYICGPDAVRDIAMATLASLGVDSNRIATERFALPEPVRPKEGGEATALTIHHAGDRRDVLVSPGRSLLQAGLAAGVPMPFSCGLGGCGACRVRLDSGSVEEDATSSLTDEERREGYVLACASRPAGPCVITIEEETA